VVDVCIAVAAVHCCPKRFALHAAPIEVLGVDAGIGSEFASDIVVDVCTAVTGAELSKAGNESIN